MVAQTFQAKFHKYQKLHIPFIIKRQITACIS